VTGLSIGKRKTAEERTLSDVFVQFDQGTRIEGPIDQVKEIVEDHIKARVTAGSGAMIRNGSREIYLFAVELTKKYPWTGTITCSPLEQIKAWPAPKIFGDLPATGDRYELNGPSTSCNANLEGLTVAWYDGRNVHYRMDRDPEVVHELDLKKFTELARKPSRSIKSRLPAGMLTDAERSETRA